MNLRVERDLKATRGCLDACGGVNVALDLMPLGCPYTASNNLAVWRESACETDVAVANCSGDLLWSTTSSSPDARHPAPPHRRRCRPTPALHAACDNELARFSSAEPVSKSTTIGVRFYEAETMGRPARLESHRSYHAHSFADGSGLVLWSSY